MPESKHRRKNRRRPRPRNVNPPAPNPEPSPTWVPITGASLLGGGVLVILLGYLPPVAEALRSLPVLGASWPLVIGFVLLAVGFLLLTRWR